MFFDRKEWVNFDISERFWSLSKIVHRFLMRGVFASAQHSFKSSLIYNCWLLLDNGTSAQSLSEFFPVQAFFRRDQSQSIG
jgi:hypothetical protein